MKRGMTFVDVLVGTSVMLLVFLSIFGAYRIAIDLVYNTKARVGGMSLVSQRLEYLRGLPYGMLGTVGGIPTGTIPQTATTTLNNIPYTIKTLIQYVDDPADGLGNSDTNRITADYKLIKTTATWVVRGKTYTTFAVTQVAPPGIESLTSGGTLRVNVFDALAAPVSGAVIRITNPSTTPVVDLSITSDTDGSVAFPGTPPASGYRITVTKDAYSSAQTYDVTVQNPNPNPGHVSVANQQTTTASFAVDRMGSLDVRAYSPIAASAFQDLFTNQSQLAATTSTTVAGGLVLLDPGTGYPPSGEARSTTVSPLLLASWTTLTWDTTEPAQTAVRVQLVYPSGGTFVPVPDAVIAGNSAGLTSKSVAISGISTSTFPSLALRAILTSTNASSTPTLKNWRLDYTAGPSPLPNIGMSMYGTKTIGTSISGAPIYKVVIATSTGAQGNIVVSPLEWDSYTLQLTGSSYDVSEQCPTPVSVAPGETKIQSLMLVPKTTNSLRVYVTANSIPVSGASVTLTAPGNVAGTSGTCGQTFFSGLTVASYTLTVAKSGYQTSVQSVPVSGASTITVPLSP